MNNETIIATNRFGLGAQPGEIENIGKDYRNWLLHQVEGPVSIPAELRGLPNSAEVLSKLQDIRRDERSAKKANEDPVVNYGRSVRQYYAESTLARYRVAASTETPFHERLVHFWSNHFAVSVDKQPLPAIAALFENEVIRPHVCGKFSDLLLAVEKHPAMIIYLDNQRSIGPNSQAGSRAKRRNRAIGLNENLAREILELHTLGVDGGYTQEDVTTFAKVITGWSVGSDGQKGLFSEGSPGAFEFRNNIHEPGSQTLLGKTYKQSGIAQGEAVLRDLADSRSTALFLARKLARHFVSDTPSEETVKALADTYEKTGGDLPAVYKTLILADEPWRQLHTKYKSPNDFVISTYRALNYVPDKTRDVIGTFKGMGQMPFEPGSPAGWPDTADHWDGANALYKRIEWSNRVARVAGRRSNPLAVAQSALGDTLSSTTRQSIAGAESAIQGMTLFLASPDFQRR